MKTSLPLVALALSTLGLCAACKSSGSTMSASDFRTIARGYQTGITTPGVEVARNEHEWEDLWSRHTSTVLPRPEIPPVDFEHEMVVFATLGTRPTMGYALEIERLSPQESGLLLEAVERRPAKDAILPQLASQPFHIIAVRQRDGDVRLSTAIREP
jgi:hypothetical protein